MKIEAFDRKTSDGWAVGLIVHEDGLIVGLGPWVYAVVFGKPAADTMREDAR